MADYQDEYRRILDEEVGDYAAWVLGLLVGGRAGGGGREYPRRRALVGIRARRGLRGGQLGVANEPLATVEVAPVAD